MAKKKKKKKINLNSDYSYKFFKITELSKISVSFGDIIIPKNDVVLMPENLNIKKRQLYSTIENEFIELKPSSNLNNSSLLILRYGGIGDILCTLFGIYELKKKFKNLHIGFISSPSYSSVLTLFPTLIDKIYAPIANINDLKKYKYICVLENVLKNDVEAHIRPIQEIYAKHMGISSLNKTDFLDTITPSNQQRTGIALQYKCEVANRNYNIEHTIELINLILDKYPNDKIYLLGKPDDHVSINYIFSRVKYHTRLVCNGCGQKSYSLLDLIMLIQNFRCVIGSDSGFLHIAGISQIPLVGLFGAFPSKLRISFYNKNAVGIDAHASCAPCFRHFPTNFCKYNCSECKCLNSIKPQLILKTIGELIGS